ncbi:maleylpyruvate isomerase family mycothiol-dependent enzyme [Streptosporangium lutulentum]
MKDERLSLADFLDELDDHEWKAASLCPGWTTHDVAAHLTTSARTVSMPAAILDTARGVIRARGDFNRMIADQARERAARFGRRSWSRGSARRRAHLFAIRVPVRWTRSSTRWCTGRTSRGRSGACGRCPRSG